MTTAAVPDTRPFVERARLVEHSLAAQRTNFVDFIGLFSDNGGGLINEPQGRVNVPAALATTPPEWRSSAMVVEQDTKVCPFCREVFPRPGYANAWCWERARFCSRSCAAKAERRGRPVRPIRERLLEAILIHPVTGCWEWQRRLGRGGYGQLSVGGKRWYAHRLSWTEYREPIPEGLLVCHHCDNHLCVNPEHLFLGTQGDNLRDMVAKGRAGWQTQPWRGVRGEQCRNARLTAEQVLAIRAAIPARPRKELAAEYGVGLTTIDAVVTRATWKHI